MSEWISVKNKLPERNADVLAFNGNEIIQNVFFNDNQFEDYNGIPVDCFPDCITHWMYLPDKPMDG